MRILIFNFVWVKKNYVGNCTVSIFDNVLRDSPSGVWQWLDQTDTVNSSYSSDEVPVQLVIRVWVRSRTVTLPQSRTRILTGPDNINQPQLSKKKKKKPSTQSAAVEQIALLLHFHLKYKDQYVIDAKARSPGWQGTSLWRNSTTKRWRWEVL